jgi:predicted phosphodiesterase
LCAALLALPLAAAWGIGHARVDDYLGPHQATFAVNYSGEIQLDLGPIGNAYLRSSAKPIGLHIAVGGVGGQSAESLTSLFSDKTLAEYVGLYTEPSEALAGVVERLQIDALVKGLGAEAVLLATFAVWALRRQIWSASLARQLSARRVIAAYLTLSALVIGSILVPPDHHGTRIPIGVAPRTRSAGLTVDSVLLADLLDRGIKGVRLLTERQQKAVRTYINETTASLSKQLTRLPRPRAGETMVMGFSDLHCNLATTELITRLERATSPAVVLSSGDDTVNGTAAERGCIRRESRITERVPFLVATGNHDSDVTEAQMKSDGMVVLDGAVVEAGGIRVLGDDDPEHNIPFSVERIHDRDESEEQLAERLVGLARGRQVDVIMVHQPVASKVIMNTANPPARLVLWGHFHAEQDPLVIMHQDGSWTVGMQQGTAGGVRQPTFTSFSTPFSPPLISADVYFYFRDDATGLITAVQPVHFLPDTKVVVEKRIPTGDLAKLPAETRIQLGGGTPSPSPAATPAR